MEPRSRRCRARSVCLCLVAALLAAGCGDGAAERGESVGASTTPTTDSTEPTGSGRTTGPTASTGTSTSAGPANGPIAPVAIEIVATHPHDPGAYTQGLEVTADGLLVESTGLPGHSTIRLVEPTTGEVVRSVPLDDELFGEGVTVVDDEVWQLTWQNEVALVHRLDDLTEARRITYDGEGWGLCASPDRLVMSDGSSRLTFRDPATFEPVGSVDVTADGQPVAKLNELECVGDLVWANVYQTTRMLAIDPSDGRVVGEADLAPLVPPGFENSAGSVANGVAHDPDTGRFWLTGKNWPVLYEVALTPSDPSGSPGG